jgi:hypothetical protein
MKTLILAAAVAAITALNLSSPAMAAEYGPPATGNWHYAWAPHWTRPSVPLGSHAPAWPH